MAANGEPENDSRKRCTHDMPAYTTGDDRDRERHVECLDSKDTCRKHSNKGDFLLAHLTFCPAEREKDEDERDYPVYCGLRDREKTIGICMGHQCSVLLFLNIVALGS